MVVAALFTLAGLGPAVSGVRGLGARVRGARLAGARGGVLPAGHTRGRDSHGHVALASLPCHVTCIQGVLFTVSAVYRVCVSPRPTPD